MFTVSFSVFDCAHRYFDCATHRSLSTHSLQAPPADFVRLASSHHRSCILQSADVIWAHGVRRPVWAGEGNRRFFRWLCVLSRPKNTSIYWTCQFKLITAFSTDATLVSPSMLELMYCTTRRQLMAVCLALVNMLIIELNPPWTSARLALSQGARSRAPRRRGRATLGVLWTPVVDFRYAGVIGRMCHLQVRLVTRHGRLQE